MNGERNHSFREYGGWVDVADAEQFTQQTRRASLKRTLSERSPASLQQQQNTRSPSQSRHLDTDKRQAVPSASKSVYAIQKEALCRELKTSNQVRKQLEEQVLALKSELRGKTEALRHSSPQFELLYTQLLEQHSALASQLEATELELETTSERAEQVSLSLESYRESLEASDAKYQAVQDELNGLRADYQDLEVAYSGQMAESEALSVEIAKCKKQYTASESELETVRQELQLTLDSNNELNRNNERASAQIDELSARVEQLSESRADLEAKLSSQESQFSEQLAAAEQQLASERDKFAKEIAAMTEEAQNQLTLKQTEHQEAVKELGETKSALSTMEAEVAKCQHDRELLRMSSSERHTLQSKRIEMLEAELSELRPVHSRTKQLCVEYQAKISALSKRLDRAESEALSLQEIERNQREALRKKSEQNRVFDSQRTELAIGLEREKEWREQLALQLERAKALNAEFKAEMQKNANDFKASTTELQSRAEALEQALASSRAEAATLRSEMHQLREQYSQESDAAKKREHDASQLVELKSELTRHSNLLTQERKTTRRLQNQIQELKGNIRIVARVRPATLASQPVSHLKLQSDEVLLTEVETSVSGTNRTKLMRVQFDRVFGPEATNHEICEETEYLIQSALDGRNVCIFAYGQTGSGKTHTMSGRDGVNIYALRKLIEAADEHPAAARYEMLVESVEIYNEQLRDLLDESATKPAAAGPSKLSIQINPRSGQPELVGAKRVRIDSSESAQAVLTRAMRHRSTATTEANQHSSRSHFVFSVRISTASTQGVLHLVDLAGSERLAYSQTTGDRLRETQAINTSLSSLGNVINALLNKKASTHVPYRSSKLTHLLQASLSGNAKTMLLTTLSPEQMSTEETKSTLRFAEKASRATLR